MTSAAVSLTGSPALDRARRKAFRRLLPILFISYFIAYVDRSNVSIAALTMTVDMPWLNKAILSNAMGIFFIGYVLLEIPGTLIVEKWSARKWISRIMISWGIVAALTACVTTPTQFYSVRFLLGLAEAGFFPGVIVYLTHWFTVKDRAKALSWFLIATPMAQMVNPKVSGFLLMIGSHEINGRVVVPANPSEAITAATQWLLASNHKPITGSPIYHPEVWGLAGWQWVYILWAIPAVVLGIGILWWMTDRPHHAKWLTQEERDALESELAREKETHKAGGKHLKVLEALRHPKVWLLTLAYFGAVTASYGVEFFMPLITNEWYGLSMDDLTWLLILPPTAALIAQLSIARSSDHFKERRYHAVVPLLVGSAALGLLPFTHGNLGLTLLCFALAFGGFKGYMPAFWSLPNLFLVEAAAAGSIGLINSFGNIGGYVGPQIMGRLREATHSYNLSFWILSGSMLIPATIIFFLKLREEPRKTT